MKRLYLFVVSVFLYGAAHAQPETQITILGVLLPGADAAKANFYMNDLMDPASWFTGGTTWPPPVTARWGNGGSLLTMPSGGASTGAGSVATQWSNAHADALVFGIRSDADIIIYFTGTMSDACGMAMNDHWTAAGGRPAGNRFQPDATGMDLSGSNIDFEAIVSTTGGCVFANADGNAIHEVAHLLGGVHDLGPGTDTPVGYGVLSNSHAGFFNFGFGTPQRRGIGARATGDAYVKRWSAPYPLDMWSVSGANAHNRLTMATTAKSVANYRVAASAAPPPPAPWPPPSPPGCSLQVPATPVVTLRASCDPYPWTSYNYWWFDQCPSATSYYQVEDSQPVGAPYVITGTTFSPYTTIFVTGAAGTIRVRACNGAGCSAPSSTSTVTPTC